MSLILSGTNGLSDVDGSAATPAIRGTDTNTGIFFPAADTVGISTGGTERARVDSAGNLGLGVTPSAGWSGTNGGAFQFGSGYSSLYSYSNAVTLGSNVYYNLGNKYFASGVGASAYQQLGGAHYWLSAGSGTAGNAITFTQAMTLDASGNLGVGTTSPTQKITANGNIAVGGQQAFWYRDDDGFTSNSSRRAWATVANYDGLGTLSFKVATAAAGNPVTGTTAMLLDSSGNLLVGTTSTTINTTSFGTSIGGGYIQSSRNVNGTDSACKFFGNAGAAYIQGNGNLLNTNNSYGSLSDAKLKENITDASPKLSQLNQVRIVNYNLIGDEKKQLGVIAQELEQIFPSMVDESIDRDEEGNDLGTTTKSVKYSVFVPMLIKAIQEQQAIITQLQADVAALKGNA